MHVIILPFSEESNNEVALKLLVKNLGEEVKIGDERSLKNNWNVGGVE